MIAQPIDYFLIVWFALALGSTAYVAWDQFRHNPEPVVMKWGFVLVPLHGAHRLAAVCHGRQGAASR